MIVEMTKYQFVLFSKQCAEFVEQLRSVGVVDITTLGYEPSEGDRDLILAVESHQKAERWLREFAASDLFDPSAKPYDSGEQAYKSYLDLKGQLTQADQQIAQLEKLSEEAELWGEFSSEGLERLSSEGIKLSYFSATEAQFEALVAERTDLMVVKISSINGRIYFVVVTREGELVDLEIDALQQKPLKISAREAREQIVEMEQQKSTLNMGLSRAAQSLSLIEEHRAEIKRCIELSMISTTAQRGAEGEVMVMEGWSPTSSEGEVESALELMSSVVYYKSRPTVEDNTQCS